MDKLCNSDADTDPEHEKTVCNSVPEREITTP